MAYYDPAFEARRNQILGRGVSPVVSPVATGRFSDPTFETRRARVIAAPERTQPPAPVATSQPQPQPEQKSLFSQIGSLIAQKLNPIWSGVTELGKYYRGKAVESGMVKPEQAGQLIPGGVKEGIKRVVGAPVKEYFPLTSSSVVGQESRRYIKDTAKSALNAVKGVGKLTYPYMAYRAATGQPVTPKEYLSNVLNTGLDTLGTLWRMNPIAPTFGATVNTLKQLRKKAQGQEVTWEDIVTAPIAGVNEQPGIGEAITDNPRYAMAIDVVFMATMVAKPFVSKKLNQLNLRAEEINNMAQTLGVKPSASLKEVEKAFKREVKKYPDTFTLDPIPKHVEIRTNLTNAYNALKKAGVIERKYAVAYDFIQGHLKRVGVSLPEKPRGVEQPKQLTSGVATAKEEIPPVLKQELAKGESKQLVETPLIGREAPLPKGVKAEPKGVEEMKPEIPEIPTSASEEKSFQYLRENFQALKEQYVKDFGNVLNPDNAKELFRPVGYNNINAKDFHEASSALVKEVYQDALQEAQGKEVLFTAGGSGVGKTTAIKEILGSQYGQLFKKGNIIFDSNLSNFESASKKLDQALVAGVDPHVFFVYRPPDKAWAEGVMKRALRGERQVPAGIHLELHEKSLETIKKLMDKYGSGVDFTLIDNSGLKGQARQVDRSFIDKIRYNKNELEKGIYEETKKLADQGKFPKEKIKSFLGQDFYRSPQPRSTERLRLTEPTPEEIERFQEEELQRLKDEFDEVQVESLPEDHPDRVLLNIADRLGKHFKAPGAVFKVTGRARTYETPEGLKLQVGGDQKSAFDNLIFSEDVDGFAKNMKVLSYKFDKTFTEISDRISDGDIDGADYDKFKDRFQQLLSERPTYAKRPSTTPEVGVREGEEKPPSPPAPPAIPGPQGAVKVIPPEEVQTSVSKEVDAFVKELEPKAGRPGFISLESLKKPDLEKLGRLMKKVGTREEQIGEDAFWQQQLFEAKRETNIRNITREVQEKFAPEMMVTLLSKVPYIDRDAATRISRSLQRLNFIKDENRQKLLYKTASAIKGLDENGSPIFGTKIQAVLDDGTIQQDWRYTPEEARLLWSKLTVKERRILSEYMAPLEKATSIFSRELLKQKAEVKEGIEGYIHKYYEDRLGDRFKKIFFKFRRAAPTKKRARFLNPETGRVEELTGNVENFEKAVIKQMENVTNAEEYNKFIRVWQELLTEPLNELNPLKKGWVEVRGTLKTGIPTDRPRIFKTEEGYGLAPQVRRQTPLAVKEMYMRGIEETSESYALTNAVASLGRYWKGNVLIYPGTAATNAISGGLQYGTKIINDFYKEGVFGGNFKPFLSDIFALVDALNPSTIEKLRPELIGAKVNIATQFGKPKNFIDKYIELGLTPFGMVETYWKRVIADATLRGSGKKPEEILQKYETFKKIGKESDIYGFNYSNIPNALEKWRGSWFGAVIYPFATYPYKYARFLERYTLGAVKEVFTGNKKDGFARLMTLSSVLSILYFFIHKKEEKTGEYVDEMRYPGEFDKTGRVKIGETEEKERYLRVIKYPWLNFMKVLQAGADVLQGQKEKGVKEISGIVQEFISEGPLMNMVDLLLGKKDKFSMYKEKGVLLGEVVKSFIPTFRINESISVLIDPEKTKQDTFEQAIERALLIKPSGEIRTGFQKKELQYDREEEFLKFAFGINIRSIDKKEYEEARNQAIQTLVHRLDDESVSKQSKERAREVLKMFGVDESEYDYYLFERKMRMKFSRKGLISMATGILKEIRNKMRVPQAYAAEMISPLPKPFPYRIEDFGNGMSRFYYPSGAYSDIKADAVPKYGALLQEHFEEFGFGKYPKEAKNWLPNKTVQNNQQLRRTFEGLNQVIPAGNTGKTIVAASDKHKVDQSLLAAMLWQESGYNKDAENDGGEKGVDRGIAQINSKAHPEVTDEQADDPEFSVHWMAKQLASDITYFEDINRGIAAYNVGRGGASMEGYQPFGGGERGQVYIDRVAKNLTEEKRKKLGIITTY